MGGGSLLYIMRVNLLAQSTRPQGSPNAAFPVSITVRPSCGLPGDYEFRTDSATLLQMLRQKTDIPSYMVDRFQLDLRLSSTVRLSGVNMSEHLLTEIGYFLD